MEKELLIQEKEKLYIELKHILARQPGPEVAEQLRIYQETLRGKTKQMKVNPQFLTDVLEIIRDNEIIRNRIASRLSSK